MTQRMRYQKTNDKEQNLLTIAVLGRRCDQVLKNIVELQPTGDRDFYSRHTDRYGQTALHYALNAGDPQFHILFFLIVTLHMDPHGVDRTCGNTVAMCAVENHYSVSILDVIFAYDRYDRRFVHSYNYFDESILHIAARRGSAEAFLWLLDNLPTLSLRDRTSNQSTMLMLAAQDGNLAVVCAVLGSRHWSQAMPVGARDWEGFSAVDYAARGNSVPVLQALIDADPSFKDADWNNNTVLCDAVARGSSSVVKYLVTTLGMNPRLAADQPSLACIAIANNNVSTLEGLVVNAAAWGLDTFVSERWFHSMAPHYNLYDMMRYLLALYNEEIWCMNCVSVQCTACVAAVRARTLQVLGCANNQGLTVLAQVSASDMSVDLMDWLLSNYPEASAMLPSRSVVSCPSNACGSHDMQLLAQMHIFRAFPLDAGKLVRHLLSLQNAHVCAITDTLTTLGCLPVNYVLDIVLQYATSSVDTILTRSVPMDPDGTLPGYALCCLDCLDFDSD
jgi:ankyrin repeat protein